MSPIGTCYSEVYHVRHLFGPGHKRYSDNLVGCDECATLVAPHSNDEREVLDGGVAETADIYGAYYEATLSVNCSTTPNSDS